MRLDRLQYPVMQCPQPRAARQRSSSLFHQLRLRRADMLDMRRKPARGRRGLGWPSETRSGVAGLPERSVATTLGGHLAAQPQKAHQQYPRGRQIRAGHQPSADWEPQGIVQTYLKRIEMEATFRSLHARINLCPIWRIKGSRLRVHGCEYASRSVATRTGGPRSAASWRTGCLSRPDRARPGSEPIVWHRMPARRPKWPASSRECTRSAARASSVGACPAQPNRISLPFKHF